MPFLTGRMRTSLLEQCTHDPSFRNRSRQELLRQLEPGDIFNAASDSSDGPIALCVVLSVEESTITARRITTQHYCKFDRISGHTLSDSQFIGTITSVEPLPFDIHNTFIEMDRKYRLGHRDTESVKLTEAEKAALLFIGDHFARYPAGK